MTPSFKVNSYSINAYKCLTNIEISTLLPSEDHLFIVKKLQAQKSQLVFEQPSPKMFSVFDQPSPKMFQCFGQPSP